MRLVTSALMVGMLGFSAGVATGLGQGATDGVRTPPAAASDELFTNRAIRHLRIEIPAAGLAELRSHRWRRGSPREDRPEAAATLREDEAVYTNVAIHLKGSAGSYRSVDSKPGLTLNFDKLAKGQRFHGLDKISLNNSVQDPTYIHEKLCRELFVRAGVPVTRADYATVELNDRYLGLYVLTEGWDKQFLKRHFKDTSGNLYDPPQGQDVDDALPVNRGDHPEDQTELRALAAAAADSNPATRLARLEKLLDFDRFLTYLALNVMLWDWDGYAMNQNNYRIFHDRAAGRVVFMPHGMDQMFWNKDGPIMTGTKGLLSRAVLDTPEGRRRYLERLARLRKEVFDVQAMTNRVSQLAARIRPSVGTGGLSSFVSNIGHDRSVSVLRQRILDRARSIDEQLAGAKDLLRSRANEAALLKGWKPRTLSGHPVLDQSAQPAALHISAREDADAAWWTLVWLEKGTYRVEARIKTRGLVPDMDDPQAGTGLRVWSDRKQTEGLNWGWFPFRNSRNFQSRGDLVSSRFPPLRLFGDRDWTLVTCQIELTEPMADLEVRCEFHALRGEAWYDLESLKIVRVK